MKIQKFFFFILFAFIANNSISAQFYYEKSIGVEWDEYITTTCNPNYVPPISLDSIDISFFPDELRTTVYVKNKTNEIIEIDWTYIFFNLNDEEGYAKLSEPIIYTSKEQIEEVYKNDVSIKEIRTIWFESKKYGSKTFNIKYFENIRKKTKQDVPIKAELSISVIYKGEKICIKKIRCGRYVGKK